MTAKREMDDFFLAVSRPDAIERTGKAAESCTFCIFTPFPGLALDGSSKFLLKDCCTMLTLSVSYDLASVGMTLSREWVGG